MPVSRGAQAGPDRQEHDPGQRDSLTERGPQLLRQNQAG
jgi:hypothetical protein